MMEIENVPSLFAEVTRAGLSMLNGHIMLPTPDDILRIPQIVLDCYEYCKNDENFRTRTRG